MGSQLKRRLWTAGLPGNLRPQSFRVLVVTDLLDPGVPLENVERAGRAAATASAAR